MAQQPIINHMTSERLEEGKQIIKEADRILLQASIIKMGNDMREEALNIECHDKELEKSISLRS